MKTIETKTYEVGLILLVHASNIEEARLALIDCMPSDLRVEAKEVQYCEESLARFTCN
ncbi:MAG TPA: hypothetical protein VIQ55_06930 [Burkholderiales bacterium]|jgi:hypothetical protein